MEVGKKSDRTAQWLLREASGTVLGVLVFFVVVVPVMVALAEWLLW